MFDAEAKQKCIDCRKFVVGAAVACVSLSCAQEGAEAQSDEEYPYAIFDLPVVSEPLSETWGINDAGILVGHSFLPGFASHAAAWYRGQLFDLGLPEGAILARGHKINSKNEIAGWYIITGGNPFSTRAIAWKDGMFYKLGTLGGPYSSAHDINEAAEIVGDAYLDADPDVFHAFRWDLQRGMVDLGTLGGPNEFSLAWGNNNLGQVVGYSWINRVKRLVVWNPDGSIFDLGSLWGNEDDVGEASDINDLGQIVGRSKTADFVYRLPILWENGTMMQLPSQDDRYYELPWAINNRSFIVGTAFPDFRNEEDPSHAVIWIPPDFEQHDIEALIAPKSGITLDQGTDINERNQIAANGFFLDDPDQNPRAFFLSPVTPELSLSDPVPGIAGQTNTWTITDAQPNAKITFLYGTRGGGTFVPKCDVLDAALQIDEPKVMGTATADADGRATLEMFVHAAVRNAGDILFQAVVVNDCAISQLTGITFE